MFIAFEGKITLQANLTNVDVIECIILLFGVKLNLVQLYPHFTFSENTGVTTVNQGLTRCLSLAQFFFQIGGKSRCGRQAHSTGGAGLQPKAQLHLLTQTFHSNKQKNCKKIAFCFKKKCKEIPKKGTHLVAAT